MPTRMWAAAGVPRTLRPPRASPPAKFKTQGGSGFTLAASALEWEPLRAGDRVRVHYRASSTPPDRRCARPWLAAHVVRVHDAAHCDVCYGAGEVECGVRRWFVETTGKGRLPVRFI